MQTPRPARACLAAERAGLALAAFVAGAAAPPDLPDGVYCASGQNGRVMPVGQSARILAVVPGPARALRFGVSVWNAQGQNFSLFGTALPTGAAWVYAPDARCRVTITAAPDHGLSLAIDPGADCRTQGGAGMQAGSLAFPHGSYEGPVTYQLANAEAFQHAGRCAGGR